MATQCSLSSLELRVQFCLLVCCTYPSSSTVNKEKNLKDQRASLRVDTRETQQSLLPKLSVTSKVSARTSCAWVRSRVHFRSSEDVALLEFTSPVDREYMRRRRKFH